MGERRMYSMQYRVQLPADYDMEIIPGPRPSHWALDGWISGTGVQGVPYPGESQRSHGELLRTVLRLERCGGNAIFLLGRARVFINVRDFGRHPHPRLDSPQTPSKGTTPLTQAHSLNIQTVTLPEFAVPSEIIEPLTADFLKEQNANTLCRLAAVDVTTWKLDPG